MSKPRIFTFTLMLLVIGLSVLSVYVYIQKKDLNTKYQKQVAEFKGLEDIFKATGEELNKTSQANNADKVSKKYESFTLLGKCGVGLAIPDETNRFDPYSATGVIDGVNRAWRLHIEPIAKVTASDKNPLVGGTRNYVILRNDNEASGYVSGYLSIECHENPEGLTTETFTTKYLDLVKKDNVKLESATGVKASTLDVKKLETVNKFGIDVNKVVIERNSIAEGSTENGYMFVYGSKIFYIHSISMATEKRVATSLNTMIDSIYLYK